MPRPKLSDDQLAMLRAYLRWAESYHSHGLHNWDVIAAFQAGYRVGHGKALASGRDVAERGRGPRWASRSGQHEGGAENLRQAGYKKKFR